MPEAEPARPQVKTLPHKAAWDRSKSPVGLKNLGNTGWMNSGIQSLHAFEPFTSYFLGNNTNIFYNLMLICVSDEQYTADLNTTNVLGCGGEMARGYALLLEDLHRKHSRNIFVPSEFLRCIKTWGPQFGAGRDQADAEQFISWLLDLLDQDLSRIPKQVFVEKPEFKADMLNDKDAIRRYAESFSAYEKGRNDSIVRDLFQGFYKSTVKCPACTRTTISFEPFNVLSVDPIRILKSATRDTRVPMGHRESLEACFDHEYDKERFLAVNNSWNCPGCNENRGRGAYITREIWKIPDCLIVHIKRFPKPGLLNVPTTYPVKGLDMSSKVRENEGKSLLFDLTAVVCHRIVADGRGYYSALVKSFDSDTWHEYDGMCDMPLV